jgi:hypothetical protein
MAITVLLEFDERDEDKVHALAESLTDYNLPIMIKDGKMDSWQEVRPTFYGAYTSIIAIEGKSLETYGD